MSTLRSLAMRDVALAAAVGIIGSGSDFGRERRGGSSFGMDVGYGSRFGMDMSPGGGVSGGVAGLPNGTSLAVPANHPMHPLHPNNQASTMQMLQEAAMQNQNTSERLALIDPNRGSSTKIERYDFSLNQALVLGTAATFTTLTLQPSVYIRPQRCAFNAPMAAFAIISGIQVGNVNALVGASTDAYIYGPVSQGIHLDLPTLSPSNKMTVGGNYTGVTPSGFPAASAFLFVASFQGAATNVT